MARPLVVVTLEGGIVQDVNVIGKLAADVVVLDFDTDGADLSEMTQIGRKRSDLAYVSMYRGPLRRPRNAKRIAEVARGD